jgi:hypothetical protein
MAIGDRKRREKPALDFAEPEPAPDLPLIQLSTAPLPGLPVPVTSKLPPLLEEWLKRWWLCDRYDLLRSGFWLYRMNGITAEDHVQQAIADLHGRWQSGEMPLPTSPADLHGQIGHRARQVSDAMRKREAHRRDLLQKEFANLSLPQVIDQVFQMEEKERKAFFERLFGSLQPRAQELLELLLSKRLDYGKNKVLAERFGASVRVIVNLKRQIERRSRSVAVNFLLDIHHRRGSHENR